MEQEKIVIRRFGIEDAQRVAGMIYTNLVEVNYHHYPEPVIHNMIEIYAPEKIIDISQNREIYVAILENKIVGTISKEKNILYTLFVDPTFHKKGIGKELMGYIEGLAKEEGLSLLQLSSSITAHPFYRKLNYRDIEAMEDDVFGQSILMEKNIASA